MNRVRKLALVASTGAIALGAGHIVQNGQRGVAFQTAMEAARAAKPTNVTPVAAGPETAVSDEADADPLLGGAAGAPSPLVAADTDCNIAFSLAPAPSASIALTLQSDCHLRERVVIRHAGLSITARTSALGMLQTDLPALRSTAEVSVLFASGQSASGSVAVPEAAALRRFAVQWQGDDAFQLHAFEGGAAFGKPGHVSAADPRRKTMGTHADGGYLTILGDEGVAQPMLAEVYTYPSAPIGVELAVEAAITAETCGRDILGETLMSAGNVITRDEIYVSMPDCGPEGDILVLKNPVVAAKIAAVD